MIPLNYDLSFFLYFIQSQTIIHSTMPRILSRSSIQSSRRSNVSSRTSISQSSEMNLLSKWFSATDMNGSSCSKSWSSSQSSVTSSMISTGSSTPRSTPSLQPAKKLGRQLDLLSNSEKSDHTPSKRKSMYLSQTVDDPSDTWGHFIDVAEAEEKIVRHSRILLAKELAMVQQP